jgi:hypothetical protein
MGFTCIANGRPPDLERGTIKLTEIDRFRLAQWVDWSMGRRKKTITVDLTLEETDDDQCTDVTDITDDRLATVDGFPFTTRHSSILQDSQQWLTDEIINAFCFRVVMAKPKVHCCSTFFYTKISASMDEAWLNRWKRMVTGKDLIVVPVNWGNSHWALVVYDAKANVLRYYDSMMSTARSRQALGLIKEAFKLCKLLPEPSTRQSDDTIGVLAFIMSKVTLGEPTGPLLKLETPSGQPQQTDGSSCGVFVCWWIAKLTGFIASAPPNPIAFRKCILDSIINPP